MVADTPAVPPAAEQAPESGEPGTTAPAVAASESSTAPAALSGDATVAAEVPASDSNANRGLDFARELAALLGDAEITELKVTVGRRPRGAEQSSAAGPTAGEEHASLDATPATPRSEAAPVVPVASRRPMQAEVAASPAAMPGREINRAPDDDLLSNAGSDRTPLPSATVAGPRDPAVVMHPAPVGTTSRRAPSRMTEGGHTLHEKDSAEGETVRVRLAQAAPQRSAPRALPFDDTQADRRAVQSRASILPEARQELPPSPEHDGEAVIVPRTGEQIETRDPSDSPDRASIATQPPSAPTNRGDSRVREALNGEARNMPDRAETKDRPAGVADRVTLQVADADGRQTRIRVTVLGDQVRAVLVPSDQESARHLERRMDDLQAALVRQGFADPKVSVQSPLAASTAAPWGAAPAGTQAEHASGRGTDQPAEDRGQGSGRQEQDRRGDGQRQSQQRFRERDRDDRQNQDAR
jgi:hypothetical protein